MRDNFKSIAEGLLALAIVLSIAFLTLGLPTMIICGVGNLLSPGQFPFWGTYITFVIGIISGITFVKAMRS